MVNFRRRLMERSLKFVFANEDAIYSHEEVVEVRSIYFVVIAWNRVRWKSKHKIVEVFDSLHDFISARHPFLSLQ